MLLLPPSSSILLSLTSLSKVVYLSTLFTRETKFLNEQKDPSKRDLTHHFIDVFRTIQEIQMKKNFEEKRNASEASVESNYIFSCFAHCLTLLIFLASLWCPFEPPSLRFKMKKLKTLRSVGLRPPSLRLR